MPISRIEGDPVEWADRLLRRVQNFYSTKQEGDRETIQTVAILAAMDIQRRLLQEALTGKPV